MGRFPELTPVRSQTIDSWFATLEASDRMGDEVGGNTSNDGRGLVHGGIGWGDRGQGTGNRGVGQLDVDGFSKVFQCRLDGRDWGLVVQEEEFVEGSMGGGPRHW